MVRTEIHVPISLNPHFARMSHLLVKSLARNANFPDDWCVVFSVSLDTDWAFDHPELRWAEDYPVEFRWVSKDHWERFKFHEQRFIHEFTADVLLLMDADTLVAGSLRELVLEVASSDAVAGFPAWGPPGCDLNEVLRGRGCEWRDWALTYAGYGLAFLSPKECPPYFNFGFIAMPRHVAQRMQQDFPEDLSYFFDRYTDWFGSQVALCLTIVRKNYGYRALDMRYNLGNGSLPSQLPGKDAAEAYARAIAAARDPRVLHYCVPTVEFAKQREMSSQANLDRFCAAKNLSGGNIVLQRVLRSLL